jgi:hypothetical protein
MTLESEMSEDIICTGCGHLGPPPEPPFLSCCPERNPVPVGSAAGIESARLSAEYRAELALEALK